MYNAKWTMIIALDTGQDIKSPCVRVSVCPPLCGHDCYHNFGPIFTKFGTQLSINILKKRFLGRSTGSSIPGTHMCDS